MVLLNQSEIEWLRENFSQLTYNLQRNEIIGNISFYRKFRNLNAIKETYAIRIDFSTMRNLSDLPKVYNTDDRIKRYAKVKKISQAEFHLNPDDSLCLIYPLKIKDRYQNGFSLSLFMEDITTFLYWVSYKSRYNEEPWKGEAHGDIALLLNYIENPARWVDTFRKLYNKRYKVNITKFKMKKILAKEIHDMKEKGELC